MDNLMEKLLISKKIMDKHTEIPRGNATGMPTNITENVRTSVELDEFQPVEGKYNIPTEYMNEQSVAPKPIPPVPTKDRILKSKLPDEIKKLMLEHPIEQPQAPTSTLSDDLVERASRLMKLDDKKKLAPSSTPKQISGPSIGRDELRDIVRETMEEILKENGLLIESTTKTNEKIQFKVGSTVFEGQITRIRKVK